TRLQSHEQSSAELTQCCKLRPRELKSILLEQRVLELHELLVQKLVIVSLVRFDAHVEATEASKNEVVANTYRLGYLDYRNNASPYCLLEHEDSKQLFLDLPPAHSEQINVVDAEAVEEQVADEAAIEEDKPQGKSAEEAKEQAAEAVEQLVCNGYEACRLRAYVRDTMLEKHSIEFVLREAACLQWR
ncbi:unnamed protein product, partial [Prunus brigantina]